MRLLQKIIENLKPEKSVKKEIDVFLKKLNKEIKKNKIKAIAVAGGSIAKGTFLKDDYDVDIFVKFDLKYKNISKLLGKILKKFHPILVHGSRDYYQIKNKLIFEIVPVLNVNNPKQIKNVTDMSPLHVKWVKRYSQYLDQIRLAKQFSKAQKVYGAESYIKGFSGHVLDILVIYYKGFIPLLKASQKWKKNTVIDFYHHHKGRALKNLNTSKISSLIVIDPIQPDRNASAALSSEKIDIFKTAARSFLLNPNEKFFLKKEFSLDEIKKKYRKYKIISLTIIPKKGKKDIIGSKLLKAFEHIRKHIRLNDFSLLHSDWKWDKQVIFYFVVKRKKLPMYFEHIGPPLHSKKHVKQFKQKHKKTITRKNRIYAKVKRKYTAINLLIKDLVKDNYVKERIRQIKILK